MIFTERTIRVSNGSATIDMPVILYRGDRKIEVTFEILDSKYKFDKGTNLIDATKATYAQLAILNPNGSNAFTDITETENGIVIFTITGEMIDELEEVGFYSFHIRLYDETKESRISLPPIENGIDIREPIAAEDADVVGETMVGYSQVREGIDADIPTFDDSGNYNRTEWETGELITKNKLNKIEDALDNLNQTDKDNYTILNRKIEDLRDDIGDGVVSGGGTDIPVTGDTSNLLTTNNMATISPFKPGYFYGSNTEVESATYGYFECSVEKGVEYIIYPKARMVSYRDSDGNFIKMDDTVNTNSMVTATPEYSGIMYVSIFMSDLAQVKIFKNEGQSIDDIVTYGRSMLSDNVSLTNHMDFISLREDIQTISDTTENIVINNNLLTDAEYVEGYMFQGNLGLDKAPQANATYGYYQVKLKAGETYYMRPRIRVISIFTTDYVHEKTDLGATTVNTGQPYVYTPDTDKIVYLTFYKADVGINSVSTESDPDSVLPLGKKQLNPNIIIPKDENASGNILYNKKWAVIGDSFTAGDYTGFVDSQGLVGKDSTELYDPSTQMWTTYPWWIMKRNDMQILNFYRSGRTLATPADGTFTNSITYNDMYKQIDADVDYITIYLGINDGHHMPGSTGDDGEDTTGEIPIGTEDDNTTATFYGAWNVMLRDLITLYPFAHIGIIVSNGMDTDEHVTATIKMAKKWGIPYLDMNSGYDVPLMIRSRLGVRTETCAEALNIRKAQQRVSETNLHPNPQTHKYQSTFIEAFLRRI